MHKNDFPIFSKHPHLIYLDSAATSQKPKVVLDAVSDFYETYNANIHRGIYPIAEKATQAVEDVRIKVARFINATSEKEIIFTNGTTYAINNVMYAWGEDNVHAEDIIITTVAEHHANFVPWQELAHKKKASFVVLDIDTEGDFVWEGQEYAITKAKVIALSLISNVTGRIYEIQKIIKKIRSLNNSCVVLVDAAQAVSFTTVDVQELDCDFFVFSGHKMFSETGIGVLYGKKSRLDVMRPFLYGGSMIQEVTLTKTTYAKVPEKFEAGTLNISGIVSLGAAIDYITHIGLDAIEQHERKVTEYCVKSLDALKGLEIIGPRDPRDRGSIVSFTMKGIHPHDIAQVLGDNAICIRAGHHCTMPLHTKLGIAASARVSVSIYNSEKDIDHLVEILHKTQKMFS